MKTLILAFLLAFFPISSILAIEQDNLPVACDSSAKILDALKRKNFQPIAIGEVDQVTTLILVNPDRDMVIAVTVMVNSRQTTCIFIGGEKNTEVFDLNKTKPDNRL